MKLMKKAIEFAEHAHNGQYRQTGEAYIIHPFAITEVLLNYKADVTTLISGVITRCCRRYDLFSRKSRITFRYDRQLHC